MSQENSDHHLQIAFKDKDGAAITNAKYTLIRNGVKVSGVTDGKGYSELLHSDKPETVEVLVVHDVGEPVSAGKAKMLHVTQKPTIVARRVDKLKIIKAKTEDHSKKPKQKVELKKYSVLFKVPTFNCTGRVSYRLVQDGKVLIEGKTKDATVRVYTDSESKVSLYIAGDKRYKNGDAYKEEVNADKSTIPAWATATPKADHKKTEKTHAFDKNDWVDVSKIYGQNHSDIISESKGIYLGTWTPPAKPKERHRRYEVKIDGNDVVLYWEAGSCDSGLTTKGRKTFTTADSVTDWYMTVDQVINRTHPKVFKVLFDVIKDLKLTYVHISSSWRPGVGSSAHREGKALDITQVKTTKQHVYAQDKLPGSNQYDQTDTPTSSEPELMEKVRLALYNHAEVEQIFTPWQGMFVRGKTEGSSFKKSYVLQEVPTTANRGESDAAFKARKAAIEKANKDAGVQSGESSTFAAHRNHLHFHIKLD